MVREGSQGFDADLAGSGFFTGFFGAAWAAIAVWESEFLRADQFEHPIFAKDLDTVHTEKNTKVLSTCLNVESKAIVTERLIKFNA